MKLFSKYSGKFAKGHEVIVKFSKDYVEYRGNSLGVTLTIGFLNELLKTYNARNEIHFLPFTTSTGSVDEHGSITSVSDEIIKEKIRAVFYSDIERFIIPKVDEEIAQKELKILKENYPKRKVRVFGIDSINDLLNRRNLIFLKSKV